MGLVMVRFKNRYVMGRIRWQLEQENTILLDSSRRIGVSGVSGKDIKDAVVGKILEQFGLYGFATVKNSLQVKYWNESTNICIFRVARDYITTLTSSLLLMKEIRQTSCSWETLHVAGTIRSCQKDLFVIDKGIISNIKVDDDHDNEEEPDAEDSMDTK